VASTGRSRNICAQNEWMVPMDVGPFSDAGGLFTRAVQLLADTQLQLAGGFVGKSNCDDVADGG